MIAIFLNNDHGWSNSANILQDRFTNSLGGIFTGIQDAVKWLRLERSSEPKSIFMQNWYVTYTISGEIMGPIA